MTRKTSQPVRIFFMAIFPIGAWLMVLYFALVIVESAIKTLELVAKVLPNS
jgi:hypothetical protein